MDLIVLLHLLFVNYYLIGEMKSTNAKILKALVFMHSNSLKIRFVGTTSLLSRRSRYCLLLLILSSVGVLYQEVLVCYDPSKKGTL